MTKKRTLPERLKELVTFPRRRALRPHEIAQYAVNITRRYPEFHDQGVDVDCANRACLVGWCEALIAKELPSRLSKTSLRRRATLLGGNFDEASHGIATVELVARRLRVDYDELLNRVYSVSNAEDAIYAFCELTGAQDPERTRASA